MVSLHKGWSYSLILACSLLLGVAGGAKAQQVFGSIIGTVTDASGGAVTNAQVTITDINKGTSSTVPTNESGNYTKGQLIAGTYKITIEAPGFSKVVSNEIIVQVDQTAKFDAALTVGNVQQQVEVTAAAPMLQTDRADVSQIFNSKEIQDLPNIGRNAQSMELLNPGTIKLGWQHASDENPQGSVQMSVNGLPFFMTGYYLDGTVNQDPILGIIVVNPTFDSLSEIKQSNQDYEAEFDTFSAGLLTYSTKSGSNSLHGDAFESLYLATPGFQDFGRNPFNSAENSGTPTTRTNQFGGSIGGRVIKDKLFFFGDAQITRNTKGGSVTTSVPTAAERTGNLGDWLTQGAYQVFDPNSTTNANGTGRTPFAGNQIPTNRLSTQALALLNYFPLPNTNGGLPYNNYSGSGALTIYDNQWNTRWDYYLNEKNTFFGRYSYAQSGENAPGVFGALAGGPAFNNANYAGSSQSLNQSLAAGWTHTVNPTLINEFRMGYMRYHVTDVPNGVGTSPATAAGIPNLNQDPFYTSGLPAFYVNVPNGLQANGGSSQEQIGYALGINQCNCPLDEFERQFQFVDNISKISGNHTLKFGGDIRYALNLRVPSDSHRSGELTFNNGYTGLVNADGSTSQGLGLGSFLLGGVTSFNRYVSSSTDAEERQKRWFFYGQDEWRPTPKLTVTYGVRWEMVFPETVNQAGNGAQLNLNTGLLDVFGAGQNSDHGFQTMNWHNFAPRFGIAYQLDKKTVIRAGYGWSYSLGTFGSNFGHNVTQNPPVLTNQQITQQSQCGNNFCDVFSLANGPPAFVNLPVSPNGTIVPPSTGVYLKTRPATLTMPVAYAYNLTVQRQLTPKISVSGGYVANSLRHGPLGGTGNDLDANQVLFVPGYTGNQNLLRPFDGLWGPRYNYGWAEGVDYYCNCANSEYRSFQALFAVKDLAGYSLTGNYTYQVSKGEGYGPDNNYTFDFNRALGYGNSNYMPHQQWVLSNTYNVPFGHSRKFGANSGRAVDLALGGWNVSAILTYYTGLPFMPNIGSYPSGTGQPYTGPNGVPDVGTGSAYSSTQNRNTWIVNGYTAAQFAAGTGPYKLPGANQFGNYPINTLIGPRFVNLDASIFKQFSITERLKFTLRLDSTNALNHTNLNTPNNDITAPASSEQITATAIGGLYNLRRLQYSGTINF